MVTRVTFTDDWGEADDLFFFFFLLGKSDQPRFVDGDAIARRYHPFRHSRVRTLQCRAKV